MFDVSLNLRAFSDWDYLPIKKNHAISCNEMYPRPWRAGKLGGTDSRIALIQNFIPETRASFDNVSDVWNVAKLQRSSGG